MNNTYPSANSSRDIYSTGTVSIDNSSLSIQAAQEAFELIQKAIEEANYIEDKKLQLAEDTYDRLSFHNKSIIQFKHSKFKYKKPYITRRIIN